MAYLPSNEIIDRNLHYLHKEETIYSTILERRPLVIHPPGIPNLSLCPASESPPYAKYKQNKTPLDAKSAGFFDFYQRCPWKDSNLQPAD